MINCMPAKDLGIYKNWRIQLMTDETNSKILFIAQFHKSPRGNVIQIHSDNLEDLKRKINHIKLSKGAVNYGK